MTTKNNTTASVVGTTATEDQAVSATTDSVTPLTTASVAGTATTEDQYIVPNDVTKTLNDGRVELVAAKGTAMPMVEAQKRGLIKPAKASKPTETK